MTTTRPRTAPTSTTAAPPTAVGDMPPLHVTRAGIPTDEHLPVHVPQSVIDQQVFERRARIVIAVIAVLCLLIAAAATIYAVTATPAPARTAPATFVMSTPGSPFDGVSRG